MALFEESVVATTVAAAVVTKANTKATRTNSLRMLIPHLKPGENKFGPSLAGVFGRKSGTEPGYNYSPAMKALNVTWDETNLDEYHKGRGKFVRGTKMVYFVPDEKDRQHVIAYLKTLPK
jgi:cytochrome c